MADFTDALGKDYLPPSPVYPIDQLTAAGGAPPAVAPSAPSPAGSGVTGGLNLAQFIGAPAGGVFGPNTGRVMSALGAGLSSAGQNWNKPALAAFASGAGAAIQGGQQFDNQLQSAKLKALQTAIAAWKVGDMAAYHQAALNLQTLMAQQRRPAAAAPAPAAPNPPAAAPPNNPPAPPASVTGSASGMTSYGSGTPSSAPPPTATSGPSVTRAATPEVIAQARDAVARGASPAAVRQRALDRGFVLPA